MENECKTVKSYRKKKDKGVCAYKPEASVASLICDVFRVPLLRKQFYETPVG